MGIVEGEVIVVKEPDSNLSVKNKIIVAESTDPGWVLLIKDAKGIIVERGFYFKPYGDHYKRTEKAFYCKC